MKFCKDSTKCQTCDIAQLCQAFDQLEEAINNLQPKVKPDKEIADDVHDFMTHMLPMMKLNICKEVLDDMTPDMLQGLVMAAMSTVADLHTSWEAKQQEIDRLKVQLEAQEAINHG